ncbi:MAG: biotin/lipoyl-binding protein [Anaerolineae bacterium]|nr:MAG: biotin/lipoyl-binding protein [Anaerolineae bacterium]
MKYIATTDEKEIGIEIVDEHHVRIGDRLIAVDFVALSDQPLYSLIVDGKSYEAYIYPEEGGWQVLLMGRLYHVHVEDEREKRLRAAAGSKVAETGEFHLKAPMPGLVVSVPVSEGQSVEKGDVLVILESMKMQNELKSPRAGTVSRIRVKPGDSVEQRQTLLSVV